MAWKICPHLWRLKRNWFTIFVKEIGNSTGLLSFSMYHKEKISHSPERQFDLSKFHASVDGGKAYLGKKKKSVFNQCTVTRDLMACSLALEMGFLCENLLFRFPPYSVGADIQLLEGTEPIFLSVAAYWHGCFSVLTRDRIYKITKDQSWNHCR